LPASPYEGILTRYVDLEDYNAAPDVRLLYDEGPVKNGQRYTPKHGPRGLYAAEGIPCAVAEATQNGLKALNPARGSTDIQLNLEVKLCSVLDLGNAKVRRKLGTTVRELNDPWRGVTELTGTWPVTWTLGQKTFDSERFDGIRYPSTKASRKYCVMIFTQRLGNGAYVRAVKRSGEPHEVATGNFQLKI
jgi:RES domain-containing protein